MQRNDSRFDRLMRVQCCLSLDGSSKESKHLAARGCLSSKVLSGAMLNELYD